jgi:hypothetical protein
MLLEAVARESEQPGKDKEANQQQNPKSVIHYGTRLRITVDGKP